MNDLTALTDEQLDAFVQTWHVSGDRFRRLRAQVDVNHPNAYRWGYAGWRCSTFESDGLREIARRENEENR